MKAVAAALALGLSLASAASAAPGLEATRAWTRPAAAGATAVGYMTISNRGPSRDALVDVQSPLAAGAMIHRSKVVGGMASMEMLSRVELPPGGSVTFAPGGYHVMFSGLKAPLAPGGGLPATLVFASGARLAVTFEVRLSPPK